MRGHKTVFAALMLGAALASPVRADGDIGISFGYDDSGPAVHGTDAPAVHAGGDAPGGHAGAPGSSESHSSSGGSGGGHESSSGGGSSHH
jgi:hypothetical protein